MDLSVNGFLALGGDVRQSKLAWSGKRAVSFVKEVTRFSIHYSSCRHKEWFLGAWAIYQVIFGFCTTGNGREKMQTYEAVTGFSSDRLIEGTFESLCKVEGLGDFAGSVAMHALFLRVGNETE